MSIDEYQPRTKLPLWRTLRDAYGTFFSNIPIVLRVTWLWLIVLGAIAYFVAYEQREQISTFLQAVPDPKTFTQPRSFPWALLLLQVLYGLLMWIGFGSIAVAWHRFLLLREAPGFSGSNLVSRSVRRYMLVYCLTIVLSGLVLIAFAIPLLVLAFALPTHPMMARFSYQPPIVAAASIAMIAVLLVISRLLLLLPAAAVGDDRITLRETWRLTKGNTWRIIWGVLLSSVPPSLLSLVVFKQLGLTSDLLSLDQSPAGLTDMALAYAPLISAVSMIYAAGVTLITVGFLSFAYRHLVEPAPPSGAAATPAAVP